MSLPHPTYCLSWFWLTLDYTLFYFCLRETSCVSWLPYHVPFLAEEGCSDSPGSTLIPVPPWPTLFPILHLRCFSQYLFQSLHLFSPRLPRSSPLTIPLPHCPLLSCLLSLSELHVSSLLLTISSAPFFIWLDLSGVLFSSSQKL